jgi:hypothetical protein
MTSSEDHFLWLDLFVFERLDCNSYLASIHLQPQELVPLSFDSSGSTTY